MISNNSTISNIACATFALCLLVITVVLGGIAWRDGNTPLVQQAMQELGIIGAAAITTLGALLGLKNFLESNGSSAPGNMPTSPVASSPVAAIAAPIVSAGVSDVQAALASLLGNAATNAASAVPAVPVASAASAGAA